MNFIGIAAFKVSFIESHTKAANKWVTDSPLLFDLLITCSCFWSFRGRIMSSEKLKFELKI